MVDTKIKKYCNLVGCIFVMMPLCAPFYFGDLITYTISYFYSRGLYDESNIGDENWILAPVGMFFGVGTFVSGCLNKKFHIKLSLLIACSILLLGFVLSYYAVSYSLWSTAVTFGCISGAGGGMSYAFAILVVTETFPEMIGTVTSIVLMGYSFGGFIFNQLITFLINPTNISPHLELGEYRVFNQTEINDRVPSTYIYLGIVLSSIEVFGILFITNPHSNTNDNYVELDKDQTTENTGPVQQRDLTLKDMLKNINAYILWMIVCLGIGAAMMIQSVYKSFGQTFINDDQFLATVGSSMALCNTVFRLFIGIGADKCGIKMTFLLTYIPSIILLFTLYEVQFLDKIWYLIWVTAISCFFSNVFIMMPMSVRTMFGSTDFLFKFSFIWNGATVSTFTVPLIVKYLLEVGWQQLFFLFGGLISVCTVLIMIIKLPLLPNCNNTCCSTKGAT